MSVCVCVCVHFVVIWSYLVTRLPSKILILHIAVNMCWGGDHCQRVETPKANCIAAHVGLTAICNLSFCGTLRHGSLNNI